jgi:hypothetical protein
VDAWDGGVLKPAAPNQNIKAVQRTVAVRRIFPNDLNQREDQRLVGEISFPLEKLGNAGKKIFPLFSDRRGRWNRGELVCTDNFRADREGVENASITKISATPSRAQTSGSAKDSLISCLFCLISNRWRL